jgi:hypothetical protein
MRMKRVSLCKVFVYDQDEALEFYGKNLGFEVRNRATITGSIEIGRAPGVVQVTFLAPAAALEARGLDGLVRTHYGLEQ